jgi:hypothetical protein
MIPYIVVRFEIPELKVSCQSLEIGNFDDYIS